MNSLAAFPVLSTRALLLTVLAALILIALLAIVLASLGTDPQTPLLGPMRWQPDAVRIA
jgi:hypothetical protein